MFQQILYIIKQDHYDLGTEGWEARKESGFFLKEFSIMYGSFPFHSLNVVFFPSFEVFLHVNTHIYTYRLPTFFHNLYNNYYTKKIY